MRLGRRTLFSDCIDQTPICHNSFPCLQKWRSLFLPLPVGRCRKIEPRACLSLILFCRCLGSETSKFVFFLKMCWEKEENGESLKSSEEAQAVMNFVALVTLCCSITLHNVTFRLVFNGLLTKIYPSFLGLDAMCKKCVC